VVAVARRALTAIAERLVELGFDAETQPVDEVRSLEGYDAVVLGSAVYVGRWMKTARTFAERHAVELSGLPVWLFSSGPLGPPEHPLPAQEPADIPSMMKLTGARGHRLFAGGLDLDRPEGDSRPWDAIGAFADELAQRLQPWAAAIQPEPSWGS